MFGEGIGRGRLIHRRAFGPFLPPFLRDHPTKYREPEGGLEHWESQIIEVTKLALKHSCCSINNWHPNLSNYWDIEMIRRETEDAMSSPKPTMKSLMGVNRSINTMSALSIWWKALDS